LKTRISKKNKDFQKKTRISKKNKDFQKKQGFQNLLIKVYTAPVATRARPESLNCCSQIFYFLLYLSLKFRIVTGQTTVYATVSATVLVTVLATSPNFPINSAKGKKKSQV
jgi:hypothetical protein